MESILGTSHATSAARMRRRVVGDTHHTEGDLVNRLLLESRTSIRAAEVQARAKEAQFSLSLRETRDNVCRAGKMKNAPLLIRLVRHPFKLRRAYFSRIELEGATSTVELRENFGVRKVLDSRQSFKAGSPVGNRDRVKSTDRISADSWLQQETLRG
jgi:hypothetical protein